MEAVRWVGEVRIDVTHQGAATSAPGVHLYGLVITPSVGGRWQHESAWPHEPNDQGIDQLAAAFASAIVLGALATPETFGTEQAWLDFNELLESGLAGPTGPWPVRRTQHGVPALVGYLAEHTEAPEDLPMRVQVAAAPLPFELQPATLEDIQSAHQILAQLRSLGATIVEEHFRGSVAHPNLEGIKSALGGMLASCAFSGKVRVGEEQIEYSDGASRIAGWEVRTRQIELRLVAADDASAALLVDVLADLSRHPGVADLDVDTTRGGFHVLASIAEPMVFLEATRVALASSRFEGAADLGAAGRWRFSKEGVIRTSTGVRL